MRNAVPARWAAAILVCRKCEKKLGGGFGKSGERRLWTLLRRRAGGKGRKAALGVIETKCLKLCPKRAVTVVDSRRPDEWLIVAAGTPIAAIALQLGLPPRRQGGDRR